MKYAILKTADNGKFYINIYDTHNRDESIEMPTRGESLKYLMRNGFKPLGPTAVDGKQEWLKEEVDSWV